MSKVGMLRKRGKNVGCFSQFPKVCKATFRLGSQTKHTNCDRMIARNEDRKIRIHPIPYGVPVHSQRLNGALTYTFNMFILHSTLRKTKKAMENGPFEDVFPVEHAMLVCQKVIIPNQITPSKSYPTLIPCIRDGVNY